MRLETAVIGPTTSKTFRKELLVLILGQPPRRKGLNISSLTRMWIMEKLQAAQ